MVKGEKSTPNKIVKGEGSQPKKTVKGQGSKPKETVKGEGSKPNPTLDDAYEYLWTVKKKVDSDKYDNFIAIMNNFKARRIDQKGCIREVKRLFKGNLDLISGFNAFLPESLEITDWYFVGANEGR
ncbi:Paired amphipathic helix protein Sin3-like 4 [Cardamine amara subsp. amara]|uniref:Paired amphipathic helix protein Sin3-like 4 n=1 Tax=Cardamine amara subsp. amara TaxID=228776 RepID=A0ABD1BP38_CARAN